LSPPRAPPLVSLPCAAGAGEGWGGVLFAGRPDKHPLPTSPLSAARPKGRGQAACLPPRAPPLVSLPCAAGAGEGWGGVLFAGRPEKHPLPPSPLSATRPRGKRQAVSPGRRPAGWRGGPPLRAYAFQPPAAIAADTPRPCGGLADR